MIPIFSCKYTIFIDYNMIFNIYFGGCLLALCFLRESLVLDTNPHSLQINPPVLR